MGELEALIFQQRRSEAAYEQRRREQLQAQRRLDDVSALERDITRAGAYQGQVTLTPALTRALSLALALTLTLSLTSSRGVRGSRRAGSVGRTTACSKGTRLTLTLTLTLTPTL